MDSVRDANNKEVNVGDRVKIGDEIAVVTQITDPDGDVDDYSRPIFIPPYVHVKYEGGDQEEDNFSCYSQARWMDEDDDFRCDDIERWEP